MKTLTILFGIVAIGVAVFVYWQSQTALKKAQNELLAFSGKLGAVQHQLDSVTDFRDLVQQVSEPRLQTGADQTDENTDAVNDLDDTVKNQRRANDNQWQVIDYLKAQRIFHKKLIDQLNTDMERIKRENRLLDRQLQQIQKGSSTVSGRDFVELKRRVNDLYSQMERARGR